MALLAIGCSIVEIDTVNNETPEREVTCLTASIENEMPTKTGFEVDDENNIARFRWVDGDQIDVAVKLQDGVYSGVHFVAPTGGSTQVDFMDAQVAGETSVADLRADYPSAEMWDWAFYPSRSNTDAQDDGYGIEWDIRPNHYDADLAAYPGEDELLTVTIPSVMTPPVANQLAVVPLLGKKSSGSTYHFSPMTGVLALTVNGLTAEMDFLTVTSSTAWLSGSFHVNRPDGLPGYIDQSSVVSGSHSVTIKFSGIEGTGKFYVPIPAGTIPTGMTVSVGQSSDPDNVMTIATKKAFTISTGVIARTPALTFTAPDQQWLKIADGKFMDDFIWAQHSLFTADTWIDIEIEQSQLHPEKYRIANPYTKACTQFGYTPYTAGVESDPYFVYFINDGVVSYTTFRTGVEDKDSGGKPMMINYSKVWSASKTGSETKIVSTLSNGTILELQFGAVYSQYENPAGYMYTRDGEGNASTQRIHITIDDDTPESWNSIGDCTFIDNFVWPYAGLTDPVVCDIQQFSHNPKRFRIAKPYPAVDADEWFEFNVSDPDAVTSVNYYTGTTVEDETHPEVTWKAVVWNGAYNYDYSNVISTQANGLPLEVQIGPCYRDSEGVFTSGYDYDYEVGKDHNARVIDIIFPHEVETWTSLGTARYRDEFMWKANGFAPYDVEVEVWRSNLDANKYRLLNPYTVANTAFKRASSGDADEYMYLQVNQTNGEVLFGSVVTGMSRESVAVEKTKNFAIADAPTWETVKTTGSAISASESKVISGTYSDPLAIKLYSSYYDSANVGYFYTNSTGNKYIYFPGYTDGELWEDYYDGTYADGLYDIKINNSSASPTLGTLAVTYQRNVLDTRRYRVANPYRANVDPSLRCATYDEYLYFTVENGLVYFEPFRPGIIFDSSPKELAFVHPVFLNQHPTESSRGTNLMTNSCVKTASLNGTPKTIELGAFYYDIATPNFGYNYPRHSSTYYPEQRIFINMGEVGQVEVEHYSRPIIPNFHNPIAAITITTGTTLTSVKVKIDGLDPSKVTGVRLYGSTGWISSDYTPLDENGVAEITSFTNADRSKDSYDLNLYTTDAMIGSSFTLDVQEVVVDDSGSSLSIAQEKTEKFFTGIRLNDANDVINVRSFGEETCKSFRIPALVTTNSGALIAAYDVRYDGSTDLQNDIDVGFKRSTDGGRTWSPLGLAMDMGIYGYESEVAAGTKTEKEANELNGIGDPCLLVDETTGDIYCFGLWAHGHGGSRVLSYAGTGYDIDDTPQFMMVKSTDDGLTWSEPVNLTRQVKRPEWRATFQGPGRGITMKDGTLVIPMQHQENGVLNAGIMYSTDHGYTWHTHNYACGVTSEAAVAEIEPGELLLTMRDETNSRYRRAYVTRDFGRSWTEHASNGRMIEPTCEASIIHVDAANNSLGQDLTIFSNPHSTSGRNNISIQISTDKGVTWPHILTIDAGGSLGYSCLTMIDNSTVGIVYESSRGNILFQAIPLEDIVK